MVKDTKIIDECMNTKGYVTEQENLEYTEKACERFLEIHPDNKYRELIAYMLDFAKKELNDLGLSEHEFKNE